MKVKIATEEMSPVLLREIVLGHDHTVPRNIAIPLLRMTDLADKSELLRGVLMDESEDTFARHLAATTLCQLNLTDSVNLLLLASRQIQNVRVLESVVKALGRIGDRRALEAIEEVRGRSVGRVASQAKFSAHLIAYRLGLDGYELPMPSADELLKLEMDKAHVFDFSPASPQNSQICLESLVDESYGIGYSKEYMYEIDCLPGISQMLLTNQEFIGGDAVDRLRARKAILAVVASKIQETGLYSTAFLVLTSPGPELDMLKVLAHRPNGDPLYAGKGQIEGDRVRFTLKSVSRPGGFAIQVEGTFEGGRFEMQMALSGSSVLPRRVPCPA